MTTAPHLAIAAKGLRKSFGDNVVLDGIDLEVRTGTIFSLLGPNGAGKTTTVQILSTLITADGGEARIAGHDLAADPDSVRAAIGVTGQFSAVDRLLTGEENLLLMADLHHLPGRRAGGGPPSCWSGSTWSTRRSKTAATYSGGMQRRLDLAMTLVGEPRIIFLDEPTTGLDPRSRRDHVADHPRAGGRRRDDLPDHPVPGGGRPARRPDRGPRPRHAGRRGHRGRAQAARPRRARPAAVRRSRRAATGRRTPSARRRATTRRSLCRSPATAASTSLRALLDRLDDAAVEVESCPCTPPTSTTSSSP